MSGWRILYQNPETARPGGMDLGLDPAPTARERLLQELRPQVDDERVMEAMGRVPRELFVPPGLRHVAYANEALPIGEGQTISQPLIVAIMTSALELRDTDTALEIGTGSGYQAAILGHLAGRVITVERKPRLAAEAAGRIQELGLTNVEVRVAREVLGWPRDAPYDAIIVTAGAPRVPRSLGDQLGEGGRLVVPVGGQYEQRLLKLTKRGDTLAEVDMGACRFVPLIGDDAWGEA